MRYGSLSVRSSASATSLLTFVDCEIGTARSQPLSNAYPLWSSLIAISFMNEHAGPPVVGGMVLVVKGVALITWQPDGKKGMSIAGGRFFIFLARGFSPALLFRSAVMV